MKYVKRGRCRNLQEYILEQTGKPMERLNRYQREYHLCGLDEAAERIARTVRDQEHIEFHTDFDVDGIGSAVQAVMMLQKMNARNYRITVPKRFSDGYGIQEKHIAGMTHPGGLLITVDNGISAIQAIETAKQKGMEVIILDHHLATVVDDQIVLPPADIIVDPEALPSGNDFDGYCAAGLMNRLCDRFFPNDIEFRMKTTSVAAISTIADSVPLHGDNRRIVQQGLWAMNHGHATAGIDAVLRAANLSGHATSEDLAYQVGPMFNAPGRLYDSGAMNSAVTMLEENPERAEVYAVQLKAINDDRKRQTKEALLQTIVDETLPVQFIRADYVNAGLLGILAGKIAEQTGTPAFVYRVTNGRASGSARSDDESQNNVKQILDSVQDLLIQHGGHAPAAGFKFDERNEASIRERIMQYPVKPHTKEKYFDLELMPQEAETVLKLMDLAEPFGHGMERPVFAMQADLSSWKPMGDGSHISFMLPGGLKALGFSLRGRFAADRYPKNAILYGSLIWDWYKGNRSPRFRIADYEIV